MHMHTQTGILFSYEKGNLAICYVDESGGLYTK